MYTISTNPVADWISTLPPDSPYLLPLSFLAAFLAVYFVVASSFAVIFFSEWYAERFTSVAGDPADTYLARALHLGLWLDGCVLVVAGVLLSPLAVVLVMIAAPFAALWAAGRGALGRHVARRRRSGKGVVEMLLLDVESPVQMGAVALVVGAMIVSQWWMA